MISVVIYGRNDNYGYNLHKRAAISFNCIAEVLTDPTEEILFVDYNTPDDFPTFPEAIQDTLTERARNLLRIFRVRPAIHERFKAKTHLVTLEPVARNVAVRRSNPSNRWILSTNTDMIFLPQRDRSLTEAARELPDGFYHAPRIEIPEALWASFDRRAPRNIIEAVRQWSSSLHLNGIVLGSDFIRYDGPGDFQLLLRDDLFKNNGFDEEMLLGWHVNSNMAKRMSLKYGEVGNFGTEIYGYHCDHARQVTPAHDHARVQNDWRRFVDDMDRSDIPEQADTWGCANDLIEEIRLVANPAAFYVQALRKTIGTSLAAPKIVEYTGSTYNKGDYDPPHLLPFLADLFVSMPRSSNVAWHGQRPETLALFADVWEGLNFTGKILLDETAAAPPHPTSAMRRLQRSAVLTEADVFIFDFGGLPQASKDPDDSDAAELDLRRTFYRTFIEERCRSAAALPPRRLIALNAINNFYERFVSTFIAAAAAPYATHMRHGFALQYVAGKQDWLPIAGAAGIRLGRQIKTDRINGPSKYLDEGTYRLSLKIRPSPEILQQPAHAPCVILEIFSGAKCLDAFCLPCGDLATEDHTFVFKVSPSEQLNGVESRVRAVSLAEIVILALTVERASSVANAENESGSLAVDPLLRHPDWLPFLQIGPRGEIHRAGGLDVKKGKSGYVVFGPYWTLPAGRYELVIELIPRLLSGWIGLIMADIATETGTRVIAARKCGPFQLIYLRFARKLRLPFELAPDLPDASRRIEARLWTRGDIDFCVQSATLRPSAASSLHSLSYLERLAGALDEAAGKIVATVRRRVRTSTG